MSKRYPTDERVAPAFMPQRQAILTRARAVLGLRWLQRIGYVATLVIAAQIGVSVWAMLEGWHHRRLILAEQNSRVESGPAGHVYDLPDRAVELMAALPTLDALAPDGLKVVAMPQNGGRWFAVALARRSDSIEGVLLIRAWRPDSLPTLARRPFTMPTRAYLAMVADIDRLADGRPGQACCSSLNGLVFGFERIKDTRVSTGMGNSPGQQTEFLRLVHDALSPYIPEIAALDGKWRYAAAKTPLTQVKPHRSEG